MTGLLNSLGKRATHQITATKCDDVHSFPNFGNHQIKIREEMGQTEEVWN
jgi:hypothetical protein